MEVDVTNTYRRAVKLSPGRDFIKFNEELAKLFKAYNNIADDNNLEVRELEVTLTTLTSRKTGKIDLDLSSEFWVNVALGKF